MRRRRLLRTARAARLGRRPGLTPIALLVTAAGDRARRAAARGALPRRRACRASRRSTPGRSGCRRRRRSTSSSGLDEQVFTTSAGPTYPPLLPILDAAAFHAMGASTSSRSTSSSGSSLARSGRGARRLPVPPRPGLAPLAARSSLVLVVPRFGERLLTPQADVLVDVFFVVAALLVALWLRDRRRLAARGRRGAPRRRGAHEARGHPVRGASWSSRGSSRRGAAAPRLAAARRRGARRRGCGGVPWRLWYRRARPERRGARRPRPRRERRPRGRRAAPLARRPLRDVALVARAARRFARARRRRSSGATAAWAPTSRSSSASAFLGGVWVDRLVRGLPITADEAVNPIVRYTGAIVLLAAAAMPLLLASVWRRAGGRAVSPARLRLARGRDRRRPAPRLPARRRRGRRALPVGRRLRQRRPSRDRRRARPRVRAARHAAEAEALLERVRGVGYVDAVAVRGRLRPLEGALRRDRGVRAGARVPCGGARRGPRGRARARTARLTAYDSPS